MIFELEISERANLMNQKLKAKLLGPPLCPYRLKPFRAVSPARGETRSGDTLHEKSLTFNTVTPARGETGQS
jgi:hypothetical protein